MKRLPRLSRWLRFCLCLWMYVCLEMTAIVGHTSSLQRIKNFRIDEPVEDVSSDSSDLKAHVKRNSESSATKPLPAELTVHFEAFGKHFSVLLARNDGLLVDGVHVQTLTDGDGPTSVDSIAGAAYTGVSLTISPVAAKRASTETIDVDSEDVDTSGELRVNPATGKTVSLNDPFARFYIQRSTPSASGQEVAIQGGFVWENVFFRVHQSSHPSVRDSLLQKASSLRKRSDAARGETAPGAATDASQPDELVILRESMDPRRQSGSSPNFSFGAFNSTRPYRCGHDQLHFNTDPRGATNDLAGKMAALRATSPLIAAAQQHLHKRAESGCPTTRKSLYVGVAADAAYLRKFDGNRQRAISNILSDFNLVSAIYEKTFNVELGILSITLLPLDAATSGRSAVPWNLPCAQVEISDRLNAFSRWRTTQTKDAGLFHLVSGCSDSEVVGIAWLNQVCQTKAFSNAGSKDTVSGTSVSVLIPNQFAVMAHEIAHNFGAVHDCDASECRQCSGPDCACCTCGPCDCRGQFVMNPESGGLNVKEFSPCSQDDICRKMPVLAKCLQEPGRLKTIKKSICGNGIVEEGEECDCGDDEECKMNPCCQAGCKLRPGAQCSDSNHPCCKDCRVRAGNDNFVCHRSRTLCQSDVKCDGRSATCNLPTNAPDGASCEVAGGKCASGICTSRDLQCRTVGKRLGIQRACSSTPSTCKLTCEGGQGRACVAMDANFIDGTPCGGKGVCQQGVCSESSVTSFVYDNTTLVIVAGVAVGVLLFLLLIRVLFTCCSRYRRTRQAARRQPIEQNIRHL